MFYHPATQTRIPEGTAFVLDGKQYPANWLNLSNLTEKTVAGIFDLVVQAKPAYIPESQMCNPGPIQYLADVWTETWEVVDLPVEAIASMLANTRSSLTTSIKAERDRRKFNGVSAQGKWIHSDTYSRTQWLGMVLMGAGIPAVEWTTMDGTSITTTQTLAGQVFQGIALLDATLFAYANALVEQVNASTDPSSINITTGWPATYEGAP